MTCIKATDLAALMSCDFDTGDIVWLQRDVSMFQHCGANAARVCGMWNTKFAGKPALRSPHISGYFTGSIWGQNVLAHRAVWALASGAWPSGQIDHINGDRRDNRLSNLRDVPQEINSTNCALKSNNSSGRVGVSKCSQTGMWRAEISFRGVRRRLGRFKRFEDACVARGKAEAHFGFTKRHGSKAREAGE